FGACDLAAAGDLVGNLSGDMRQGLVLFSRLKKRQLRTAENGSDFHVGARLPRILAQSGFQDIQATVHYENYGTPDRVRWMSEWFQRLLGARFEAQATALGWADSETLVRVRRAWADWADKPGSYYALARFGAVGRKPNDFD